MSAKPWVVIKFGGTSVATVQTWGQIIQRVQLLQPTNRVWIVVSALSKVTNALLSSLDEATSTSLASEAKFKSYSWVVAAHEKLASDMGLVAEAFAPVRSLLEDLKRLLDGISLTGEVSPRLRARVAAFGELLSSQLGVAYLNKVHVRAIRLDSRSLLTSDVDEAKTLSEADIYLEADVKPSTQADRCDAAAQGYEVVICQGFIASTPSGSTCLLGRGGSDTSAALLAALCGAQRLEIWTDVNGMFTADPRHVSAARLIRSLTYREAQELAAMGAKVLHPRCLLPAAFASIPVEVRNTMDPSDEAEITVVSADGLDYQRSGKVSSSAAAAGRARQCTVGTGASSSWPGSGAAPRSSTPSYTAMPPPRPPSPLSISADRGSGGSSSNIVFTNEAGEGEAGVWSLGATPTQAQSSGTSSLAGNRVGDSSPARSLPSSPSSMLRGYRPCDGPAKMLAVARRKGVTLVTLSAYDMWGNAGFLSKVFAPFGTHGVSVDLIATSQYAVSLTLDHIPEGVYGETFRRVTTALGKICTTTVRYPCAVVSVVGRSLRNALPALGKAMAAFEGARCHMVSEASEDLNMSFVVDEDSSDDLVAALHKALLESDGVANDSQFGPVWTDMPCGKTAIPGEAKH